MDKVSLFEELKKGGYETSLITTFNIDFPFYEDVILRRMSSKGIRHHILMMDANQCMSAINEAPPLLAGRHYSLLPMRCGGAFHPKLLLLLGKRKGLLAIGSHNMTLSGFGLNVELTNVFRFALASKEDTLPIFWQAWLAITEWLDAAKEYLPESVIEAASKCTRFADWLRPASLSNDSEAELFFSSAKRPPLWEQCLPMLPNEAQNIYVIGAFFDKKLAFLNRLETDFHSKSLTVGIQPDTVSVPNLLLSMNNWKVVDSNGLLKTKSTSSYIHAKAIWFQSGKDSAFVSGSANPSAPAWLKNPKDGNVEAVVLRRGPGISTLIKSLGLLNLDSAPVVKILPDNERIALSNNHDTVSLVIAVARVDQLELKPPKRLQTIQLSARLIDNSGRIISDGLAVKLKGEELLIKSDSNQLNQAVWVELYAEKIIMLKAFIHFAAIIERNSVTGTQKRFMDALGSLNTDSPELKILFDCIDDFVFSDKISATKKTGAQTTGKSSDSIKEGGGLSIDLADVKKHTGLYAMGASDDLSYILDALIHGLSDPISASHGYSNEDKLGRSEEDLVNTEDEYVSSDKLTSEDSEKLLNLCHRKVNRITNQARDLLISKGKVKTHEDISLTLRKLLAVLSLIKTLMANDEHFSWVPEGKTSVPQKARKQLFEALCQFWWSNPEGVLNIGVNQSSILPVPDVQNKLIAYFIWYGWLMGVNIGYKAGFLESKDESNERILFNSIAVMLSQLLLLDSKIYDETEAIFSSSEKDGVQWLEWLAGVGRRLQKIANNPEAHEKIDMATGDLVLHRKSAFNGLRLIHKAEGSTMAIVNDFSSKSAIRYQDTFLSAFSLRP